MFYIESFLPAWPVQSILFRDRERKIIDSVDAPQKCVQSYDSATVDVDDFNFVWVQLFGEALSEFPRSNVVSAVFSAYERHSVRNCEGARDTMAKFLNRFWSTMRATVQESTFWPLSFTSFLRFACYIIAGFF